MKATSFSLLGCALCMIIFTPILSFSQTPEPADQIIIPPLVLPAYNVKITYIPGGTHVVNILSKTRHGINCVMSDDTSENPRIYNIGFHQLNEATVTMINGTQVKKVSAPTLVMRPESLLPGAKSPGKYWIPKGYDSDIGCYITDEEYKRARLLFHGKTAAEILEIFADKESADRPILYKYHQKRWGGRSGGGRDWYKYNLEPSHIFHELDMEKIKNIDYDEVVSLRPQLEKMGIKSQQQIGGSCTLYSFNNIANIACRKAGIQPLGIAGIRRAYYRACKNPPVNTIDHMYFDPYLIKGLRASITTKKLKVLHIWDDNRFSDEIIKHQLRKGRAVRVKNNVHAFVIVGFRYAKGLVPVIKYGRAGYKPGTTVEYQILDTNRLYKDNGYRWQCNLGLLAAQVYWFE